LCRVRVVPRGASLELEAGVSWSFTVGCAIFFVSVEYRMPAMNEDPVYHHRASVCRR
jgi:hypothetical protein